MPSAKPFLHGRVLTSLIGPRSLAALSIALLACSGNVNPATSCGKDPFSCGATQACWPSDSSGGFSCIEAKAYKKRGDDCELVPARAGCGPGLICATRPGFDAGFLVNFCTSYCDPLDLPRHGCPAGEQCQRVELFDGESRTRVDLCAPVFTDGGVLPDLAKLPDLTQPAQVDLAMQAMPDMAMPPAPDMATPPQPDMAAPPLDDLAVADDM